jgi:bile acid:Na+ symporter, BASS family
VNLHTLIPLALKASIFLNVFAIGLRASLYEATYLFRRPGQLVRGLLAMNVLMPMFAVALVLILDLNPAVQIALVALSVSPIPPVLPKKMMKAGSTEPYSIGLLVAVGLLAIFLVPVEMKILQRVFELPLQMTMASIAVIILKTVLLPLALGIVVHRFGPARAERLAKPISQVGSVGLLVCGGSILITVAPGILALVDGGAIAAIAAFVLAGFAVGHWLGGPEAENRTALAFATASRHPGIAIAMAHANFPKQKLAMAGVLLYLVINTIVTMLYNAWTRRRASTVASRVKS